ncbi:MAG: NBR1-Ig-like domain-containing protein, partial [Chloroflexota bacterium]|nr:NBR1-Ig-like domain-containing protein [Chloroflexota bacterium]
MSKKKYFRISLSMLIIALLASCNMPSAQQTATQSPEDLQTSVAQTVTANAENGQDPIPTDTPEPEATAETLPSETPTLEPTNTTIPTNTPTPTNTPVPCNRARFITDVTIPDGTILLPGETFVKTWRLQNTGSCSWSSGYDIVFIDGDAMGAPSAVQLTNDIIPSGGTVDVSVTLVAPASTGTYKGNWRLRDASDQVFGIVSTGEFWVEIEVVNPTNTPEPQTGTLHRDP